MNPKELSAEAYGVFVKCFNVSRELTSDVAEIMVGHTDENKYLLSVHEYIRNIQNDPEKLTRLQTDGNPLEMSHFDDLLKYIEAIVEIPNGKRIYSGLQGLKYQTKSDRFLL